LTYINVLDKYIKKNETVLIHCAHGMSRSVSFVIYYLVKKNGISAKDALKYIRHRRSIAYPCHDYTVYLQNKFK